MLTGKILITGGAGTLGTAIIKRATEEKWDCHITIMSTDPAKHSKLLSKYPKVSAIIGDVRDYNALLMAMTGKDIVIHAAAVKRIPESEWNSIDCFQINVQGSLNVCAAAMYLHTPDVIGISTDKACHPANAYGATKMMMEKGFQEYSRLNIQTKFHLVRYGNVLESNGSVIESWKNALLRNEPITMTDPSMTRFWLSPSQGVDYVLKALQMPTGCIYVPMMKALPIGKLAEYTIHWNNDVILDIKRIPLRPGEKMHETLVTEEEGWYAEEFDGGIVIQRSTDPRHEKKYPVYSSDIVDEFSRQELMDILK